MRIGVNPAKDYPSLDPYCDHRIIVPVYIPALTDYFTHALEILKLSLESLRRTASHRANVTLIANGVAPEVINELEWQLARGWVDQLVINRQNRGKVDAVLAVARGAFEEYVTIADCDVLFRPGWLDAVASLLRSFPECGFAAPFPNPTLTWHHTSATVLGGLARHELGFAPLAAHADLERFANSVGRPQMFQQPQHRTPLVVRRGDAVACVGAGHFVFTARRSVLQRAPQAASRRALGKDAVRRWLDVPPDRLGLWRLSTTCAYVQHMGNTPMPWMYDELMQLPETPEAWAPLPSPVPLQRHWTGLVPWPLRRKLAQLVRTALPLMRHTPLRSLVAPI